MDSILKNHPDPYNRLFSPNIAVTFCHVFEYSNHMGKKALFELRGTWMDIFPLETLLDLDKSIQKIDPAWPIWEQKSSDANILVNSALSSSSTKVSISQL